MRPPAPETPPRSRAPVWSSACWTRSNVVSDTSPRPRDCILVNMEADINLAVEYRGGASYACKTRGHELITDLARDQGGHDRGMTPPELMLASLGSCAAYYATQYLKAHGLDTTGLA